MIHPKALVDPKARVDDNVSIGPYAIIGADVEIGAGTSIRSHAIVEGPTKIGCNNQIYSFASIGIDPQDKKYADEATLLEIGDDNVIREYCTLSRGTAQGGGVTRLGNGNWIMAYVHIAHDCMVGSNTIFANSASLAGHVTVGDYVIFGGFTLVHQFCVVGPHSFTAKGSVLGMDLPPYVMVAGHPAKTHGINSEGLKRRGFSTETISAIRKAYKILYKSGLRLQQAQEQITEMAQLTPELKLFVDFFAGSTRGITR